MATLDNIHTQALGEVMAANQIARNGEQIDGVLNVLVVYGKLVLGRQHGERLENPVQDNFSRSFYRAVKSGWLNLALHVNGYQRLFNLSI